MGAFLIHKRAWSNANSPRGPPNRAEIGKAELCFCLKQTPKGKNRRTRPYSPWLSLAVY